MPASKLLDVETKLSSDYDGLYRAMLIEELERYRDEFAFAKQGLLPPDEHEVAEEMANALEAAITIVKALDLLKADTAPDEKDQADAVAGNMFSV